MPDGYASVAASSTPALGQLARVRDLSEVESQQVDAGCALDDLLPFQGTAAEPQACVTGTAEIAASGVDEQLHGVPATGGTTCREERLKLPSNGSRRVVRDEP
jgi:hypothetical protein